LLFFSFLALFFFFPSSLFFHFPPPSSFFEQEDTLTATVKSSASNARSVRSRTAQLQQPASIVLLVSTKVMSVKHVATVVRVVHSLLQLDDKNVCCVGLVVTNLL
jgi:hypothetical protein